MINLLSIYNDYTHEGFKFSQNFVNFVTTNEVHDLEPWWFFCREEKFVNFWCAKIKELYPNRNLVPFANWIYTDDIACFDGDDKSGDPKVYYVHAFASSGWEDRGSVENFDKWLKLAQEESAQYKADRAE